MSLTGEKTKPMKLAEVTSINVNRTKTEMEEFNRVLGGGVVPGSLVLIGGGSWDWEINPSPTSLNSAVSSWDCSLRQWGRSLPSRLSYEQSAWVILIVSFIFMQRPICRVFELRWSASSQTSSSSTPFRLLCLLRFQGCRVCFSGA